mmetsp:Transcript_26442/g.69522  ORF Transcript_26442/g.69522 Transcript_26442/m.69522 type:complete len:244 (+) Transcript_26442:1378-2109(+)
MHHARLLVRHAARATGSFQLHHRVQDRNCFFGLEDHGRRFPNNRGRLCQHLLEDGHRAVVGILANILNLRGQLAGQPLLLLPHLEPLFGGRRVHRRAASVDQRRVTDGIRQDTGVVVFVGVNGVHGLVQLFGHTLAQSLHLGRHVHADRLGNSKSVHNLGSGVVRLVQQGAQLGFELLPPRRPRFLLLEHVGHAPFHQCIELLLCRGAVNVNFPRSENGGLQFVLFVGLARCRQALLSRFLLH